MEKQPDEPEDFTNEPIPSMSGPMKVQDAVASTSASPFEQPIKAALKSKAGKQLEYRQRITESRTPARNTPFISYFSYHRPILNRITQI
ncbi:hypothetical protein HHI36_009858, partial [Cryptolaemus montrouzieri]